MKYYGFEGEFGKNNQKYKQIQKSRTVSDKKIIILFGEDISVPKAVANEHSNNLFNYFINTLSKIAQKTV